MAIASDWKPVTVSLSAPTPETWPAPEPESRMDSTGEVVRLGIFRPESGSYSVTAPVDVYGQDGQGRIVALAPFGSNPLAAADTDPSSLTDVLAWEHVPGVLAYWLVAPGITGTPDIRARTQKG